MKVVGIATIIAAVFYKNALDNTFIPESKLKYPYILFFVLLFTFNPHLQVISTWAVCVVMYFIVISFVDTIEKIIGIYIVIIGGMLINCYQSLKGVFIYGWYERAAGSYGDANYLSLALLVGIISCYTYILYDDKYKVTKYLCMLILFITMMLAASRGCILGLIFSIFLIVKNSEQKMKYLTLIIIVSAPIIYFVTPKVIDRFSNKTHSDYSSIEHRKNTQLAGINMVIDNPVTGVGYGTYKDQAKRYNEVLAEGGTVIAHNTYLQVAAELGVPALIVFLTLITGAYSLLSRLLKLNLNKEEILVCKSLMYMLAGYSVSILFLSAEKEKFLWLILALTVAVWRIIHARIFRQSKLIQETS